MTQTTEKISIPNLKEGETGFLLDGSLKVAVSVFIKRDPITSELTAFARARAVDDAGTTLMDDHGNPIETTHPRSCPGNMINDPSVGGHEGLAREAVLLVLGDEEEALGEADNNIRHSFAAAQMVGEVPVPDLAIPA
jgi:hypothetical protein